MSGSPVGSTRRSLSTTPYGPPPSTGLTGPIPPPSGRMPSSGSSSISTSAIIQLVDGARPGNSIPAALRTRLRPPSQPTRYCARNPESSDSATSTPVVVLREADDLTFAKDRHAELLDPVGQDRFEEVLPQRQEIAVAGGEVADVHADPREAHARVRLPGRDEAFARRHADRAPRWCGSGDRRRASRRDPDSRAVRR